MRNDNTRPPLPGAGYVEDFTTPFLVVTGVLTFFILCTIWAVAGWPMAVLTAFAVDRLLCKLCR